MGAPRLAAATIDQILTLQAQGYSAALIAEKVGGLSRSAVCGLLNRKGVKAVSGGPIKTKPMRSGRVAKPKPATKAKPAKPIAPVAPREKAAPIFDLPVEAAGCSWSDHDGRTQCNWPTGVGMWCSEIQEEGSSWCSVHHVRAVRILEPPVGKVQRPHYRAW
jgi:hypothetical protein